MTISFLVFVVRIENLYINTIVHKILYPLRTIKFNQFVLKTLDFL